MVIEIRGEVGYVYFYETLINSSRFFFSVLVPVGVWVASNYENRPETCSGFGKKV